MKYKGYGQDYLDMTNTIKKHERFDFHNLQNLQNITKREVVGDDPLSDAIVVGLETFVKFVVRHFDETI